MRHQLLWHGAVLRSLSCDRRGYVTLHLIAAGLSGVYGCVCVCVCVCENQDLLTENSIVMEASAKQTELSFKGSHCVTTYLLYLG